jgi:hypothetical protein
MADSNVCQFKFFYITVYKHLCFCSVVGLLAGDATLITPAKGEEMGALGF